MKLLYSFKYVRIGGETTAVPVGTGAASLHGVLTLNETGEEMLRLIEQSETPEDVLGKLMQAHPEEDIREVAELLCGFLNRLLEEQLLKP